MLGEILHFVQDDNVFYILDVVRRGRIAIRPYNGMQNEGRRVKTRHYVLHHTFLLGAGGTPAAPTIMADRGLPLQMKNPRAVARAFLFVVNREML